MKTLKEAGELAGKRVIVRVDLNMPIADGAVRDDYRLRRSLPTINYLRNAGAKLLLIGHLESKEATSLAPVAKHIEQFLPVRFATTIEEASRLLGECENGEAVLLENLRSFGSLEKDNDPQFAQDLAALGDIYVNEAFSVCHREHASIVGIPKLLPSYAGLLLEEEVKELSKAFSPKRPFIFILGGAKFDTKMPLVKKFLAIADKIYSCGALSNDIYKARGLEVGRSIISDGSIDLAEVMTSEKVSVPTEVVVEREGGRSVKKPEAITADDKIMDAGGSSLSDLELLIRGAGLVLWNGPLGDYESGFSEGTEALAKLLSESKAETIVGGGDTLAVIEKAGLAAEFTFVSTGGGAMLDFLANGTLVGIQALEEELRAVSC